jgi:tellurium resistance protein TerD
MATANLRKGQRVELAKGLKKLRIELTWQASRKAEAWDLDIMGIELDDDQLLCKDDVRRFVFYGNEKLSDPEGALVHSGDDRTGEGDGEEMILNLNKYEPSSSIKTTKT